jgi:hypothetical protein
MPMPSSWKCGRKYALAWRLGFSAFATTGILAHVSAKKVVRRSARERRSGQGF